MLQSIYSFIKQYKYTILTIFYFCLITLYPINLQIKILPIIGCLSMFFILNIIAKIRLSYFFAAILIILTTFNAYVAFAYSTPVSSSIIAVVFESNADEIKSAFTGLILPVLVLLAITSFLTISSIKELKGTKVNIKISSLILLVFIGFLSAATFRQILIFTDFREEYNKAPLDVFAKALNRYTPFFYGNVTTITSYLYDIYLFNTYTNAEKRIPEGITFDKNKDTVSKIFLVIGESANADHLSLFGYHRPTTPFLDSLHSHTEIISAYHGRAIASQTKNAVPGIVSSNTPRDQKKYREEYSLIELAKKNGYATYWISNQNTSGIWNGRDAITAIAGQADYTQFWDGGVLKDDFTLLPDIEKYFKKDNSKQLFIVHLQGSHFLYEDKYDKVDEQQLPGEATLELHYDRSIHHTDRFLKNLYSQYIKKGNNSSVMLYVSDHGQEIQEMFGHGVGKATKKQFHTPIVSINNSALPMDTIMSKYVNLSDSIISNNSIPEILSELIGYSVSKERITQSILDGEFVLHGDDKVYRYDELP